MLSLGGRPTFGDASVRRDDVSRGQIVDLAERLNHSSMVGGPFGSIIIPPLTPERRRCILALHKIQREALPVLLTELSAKGPLHLPHHAIMSAGHRRMVAWDALEELVAPGHLRRLASGLPRQCTLDPGSRRKVVNAIFQLLPNYPRQEISGLYELLWGLPEQVQQHPGLMKLLKARASSDRHPTPPEVLWARQTLQEVAGIPRGRILDLAECLLRCRYVGSRLSRAGPHSLSQEQRRCILALHKSQQQALPILLSELGAQHSLKLLMVPNQPTIFADGRRQLAWLALEELVDPERTRPRASGLPRQCTLDPKSRRMVVNAVFQLLPNYPRQDIVYLYELLWGLPEQVRQHRGLMKFLKAQADPGRQPTPQEILWAHTTRQHVLWAHATPEEVLWARQTLQEVAHLSKAKHAGK